MSFNALAEKGIPLEKQLRTWHDIVKRPYNRTDVDCYTRTRQILMNGIEVEAWNFKHHFARTCHDIELKRTLARIRRIEDMQQTTVNWLAPANQSVLDTTLGYEQVAVDLTAWLAQNEPDDYVKETFDFGLLEDFDHLYRYSQWAYLTEGTNPNLILQDKTDVVLGRPTQNHHNCNGARVRKHYDKTTTSPITKVNILTLLSGEQQTHNYYAEHGFMYGNDDLRRTYAEICDVEEEHVTMYESLIDPTESMFEKLLLHEFTEVCNYYNCYKDETNPRIKQIWEEFTQMELGHLQIAAELFKEHERRDPEEVIGEKIVLPCHFESQKDYVTDILTNEIDKRLDGSFEMSYSNLEDLPEDWVSYEVQREVGKDGAPTEQVIQNIKNSLNRDITIANKKLVEKQPELLSIGLEPIAQAPNTVTVEDYEEMTELGTVKFCEDNDKK